MILGTLVVKQGIGREHQTDIWVILPQRQLLLKAKVWKNSFNERSYRHRVHLLHWRVGDHTQNLAVPLRQKLRIKHIQESPVN